MKKLVVAATAVVLFAAFGLLFAQMRERAYQIGLRDGALLTRFCAELQNAADCYYGLERGVTVAYYTGAVLSVSHVQYGYYVTFRIQPYVGPHNAVGVDEVTYLVSNSGTVKLESFVHVKADESP